MAIVVETFEVQEVVDADTQAEAVEMDSEAIRLISELGLGGQQKLLVPEVKNKEQTGDVVRSPYRRMTRDELFVYGTLCPQRFRLAEYEVMPIPLRVLQVAAHAREHFELIEVWDRQQVQVHDPVLVGVNYSTPGNQYSGRQEFILARWGEHLDEWSALLNAAVASWKLRVGESFKKVMSDVKSAAGKVDDLPASKAVELGAAFTPSFYDRLD